jgi:hypothetical protein
MKTVINRINGAARWAAHKSGASLRLATGITGDVVATGINLTGGVIAVTGGIVAAVGVGTYATGAAIMRGADHVSEKAQAMTDKAYDDLMAKPPAPEAPAANQQVVEVESAFPDFAPPAPAMG